MEVSKNFPMLSKVLARESHEEKTKKEEPSAPPPEAKEKSDLRVAVKNYKGFDIVEKDEDSYQLFDRKQNSMEKKIYLSLDSAKKAADDKFEMEWKNGTRKTEHSLEYPVVEAFLRDAQ